MSLISPCTIKLAETEVAFGTYVSMCVYVRYDRYRMYVFMHVRMCVYVSYDVYCIHVEHTPELCFDVRVYIHASY
jgi:hypothetical protein